MKRKQEGQKSWRERSMRLEDRGPASASEDKGKDKDEDKEGKGPQEQWWIQLSTVARDENGRIIGVHNFSIGKPNPIPKPISIEETAQFTLLRALGEELTKKEGGLGQEDGLGRKQGLELSIDPYLRQTNLEVFKKIVPSFQNTLTRIAQILKNPEHQQKRNAMQLQDMVKNALVYGSEAPFLSELRKIFAQDIARVHAGVGSRDIQFGHAFDEPYRRLLETEAKEQEGQRHRATSEPLPSVPADWQARVPSRRSSDATWQSSPLIIKPEGEVEEQKGGSR